MGNSTSNGVKCQGSERNKSAPFQKLPMPDHEELEKRFNVVLTSMDLPPDKAKLLRSYDDEKKWDIICDQERVSAKDPPEIYLDKLKLYLDPVSSHAKSRKGLSDSSSTQTLRDLEISLRTNNIDSCLEIREMLSSQQLLKLVKWVRLFLSETHRGLDVLVDYLAMTQDYLRWQQETLDGVQLRSNGTVSSRISSKSASRVSSLNGGGSVKKSKKLNKRKSEIYGTRHKDSKLKYGEATDDVHICIMCLRAIMNHQNGFNLVFGHAEAINCIALSLNHKSFRTKTLVLELLAAICLVGGGHQLILSAFDNFKLVCLETHRFSTLMSYFMDMDEFNIDFMVACMQFINIVVHSVEDMNFRVHLQHEFSLLHLDDFLGKLRHTESDRLPVQVNAYLDNTIDVQILLEDSDIKNSALERVAELEEELSHANERAQELEDAAISKLTEMQRLLSDAVQESDLLKERCQQLESQKSNGGGGVGDGSKNNPPPPSFMPPPPPPPPAPSGPPPPPPPGPPPPFGGPAPPPPPPGFPGASSAMTIKRKVQPKYRLPVLNWISMKPNQVKGTMFSEIDDEKLYPMIDFNKFEEMFKLGNLTLDDDAESLAATRKAAAKKVETVSLLETNRLRNVAITRRKIEMSDEDIIRAINGLDLKTLSLDRVENLLRVAPNEQELKAFKEYEKDKKPIDVLSDEDKFMMNLMKVERLSPKLHIMSFIGNFFDTFQQLSPQLKAVAAASTAIKNSTKIRKLIEVILAFGNYMNSFKKGAVYGFKLQSLDMLMDTKSNDKKISLLHFIVMTIEEKFPDVKNFEQDLQHVEKASAVSLENIRTDLVDLEKGMEMTRKEFEARRDRDPPVILRDFLQNSDDKIKQLNVEAKAAEEKYRIVVEYFGENAKTLSPNTFFSLFVRFTRAYKQALLDLENLRKLEEAQLVIRQSVKESKKVNQRQTQAAVVGELRQRQRQINDKKITEKKVYEVYDGALEDILMGLKNEPYRRADAMSRSQRRRGPDVPVKN